jgi:non-ribosomal peptide synthetase component F
MHAYPKDRTLSQLFEQQAAKTPQASAVSFGAQKPDFSSNVVGVRNNPNVIHQTPVDLTAPSPSRSMTL